MESPDKCDKCVGYSICANHIKKGDIYCAPFLRAVEEKFSIDNNAMFQLLCDVKSFISQYGGTMEKEAVKLYKRLDAALAQQKHS